jgi:YVTN family beta-propeller protein
MAPKSIVADQRGRYFAMNVMYGHSITVFNRRYKRIKDISDTIDLSRHGHPRYRTPVQGAPVEGAVSRDGRTLYVSNYSMYGEGFEHPGFDLCTPRDRIDRSFVYAIDTRSLRKKAAIQVGAVPKYLAITPDGRTMLVGNWCSWDISVVDLRKGREVARIPAGVAPRGMAFSPNGRRAYVTLVGEDRILVIDMRRRAVIGDIGGIGERPRHLVMSPNGRYLYVTSEGKDKPRRVDGVIHKISTRSGRVVASSEPLTEPRTTVMSDDGTALYVVDYYPGTIVKLATDDLAVLQERYLGYHPVGATYDNVTDKVWVAGYGGQVWVLTDR